MIEKHIVIEDIDPVILYGVGNSNLQMVKALYPKLRIVARGNVVHVMAIVITETMLNTLKNEIESLNYPEPPEAFYFIDVNNYPVFRDKAALVAGNVGAGCSRSGSNVIIQHNQWKNVVGFETYKADGTLLHITNYGHGNSANKPQSTTVVWNTSEQPAYIMAVGFDGTRVKCYEP